MHEYVSFVLTLAREDGALALAVAALVLAGAGMFCLIRRRRFPRVRALALALLSGYLAALANMTVTGRGTFDVDDLFTNTLGAALG